MGDPGLDMGRDETVDSADARFSTTEADSQMGTALHAGVSLNGDPRAEILIGASDFDPSTGAGAGAVFGFRGREL